jgi:hypothetical protein
MTGRHGQRHANRHSTPSDEVAPFRLAVGLGDPQRERSLLPLLAETGDFAVAERCLAADQLVACLHRGEVDAALLAADLHRLTESVLAELARSGVPIVLLAARPDDERWHDFSGRVLPLAADPAAVGEALLAAIRAGRCGVGFFRCFRGLASPPRATSGITGGAARRADAGRGGTGDRVRCSGRCEWPGLSGTHDGRCRTRRCPRRSGPDDSR